MKYMSLKEFRDIGLLQEVNRRLLHPIGLALAISKDENGEYTFDGVQDCREYPQGMYFGELNTENAKKKKMAVDQLIEKAAISRISELGFFIQPIETVNEMEESYE